MDLGKFAYNSYKKSRDGITFTGDKMKEYEEMSIDLQESWDYMAIELIEAYKKKEISESFNIKKK